MVLRNVVDKNFERRLAGLINSGERAVLRGGRKGVEKESLRATYAGDIAQTRHPEALGAPLTDEHITTDFSESLIELVTPPFGEAWELLQYLCDIHQFVYRHLEDELLWATSMPCAIDGDASIPLAQFGSSNVGRMKTIYRHGLGVRWYIGPNTILQVRTEVARATPPSEAGSTQMAAQNATFALLQLSF